MGGTVVPGGRIRIEGVEKALDCPSCGARVVHDRAFVPWCEGCEWNVEAGLPVREPPGRLGRLYERLHRTDGDSLYRQLVDSGTLRPRMSLSRIAAWVISAAVFATWGLLVVAGIAVVASSSFILGQAAGVVLLVIAVVVRPRFRRGDPAPLHRDDAPELYSLVDELAERLQAPPIHAIHLRQDWNAATFRFGLRQRHALALGLPVWAALGPQERVAVLAHEVAHGVNGDTLNGVVVGNATETLVALGNLVVPDRIWPETGDGFVDLAAVPVNILALGVALGLYGLAGVIVSLTFRDSRRAEFYADRLAASVAGRDALVSALGILRNGRAFSRAAANTLAGIASEGLWVELRDQLVITPPSELERMRRAERRFGSRLDHTHPPTYQREQLLQRAPSVAPTVVLDPDRAGRIDAELVPSMARVAERARKFELDPEEPA